jgi:hypothetical protein
MTVAVSGESITFADSSIQNTAATGFGFKNRIINGAMVIDQRNAGASVSADNSFPVDRFKISISGSATATAQRSTTVPSNFTNSTIYTIGTGAAQGTSSVYRIFQAIEGFNTADFGWGSASATTVTLSFWVRSSVTGTFAGGLIETNGGTASYVFNYTVSAANTWEQKTVTVTGPTIGTWQTGSSASIAVVFDLGSGTNFEQAAGSWTSSSNKFRSSGAAVLSATSGATFYITGVQLEKGSTATSFDYRPYGTELVLCQRYLYAIRGSLSLGNWASVGVGCWDGSNGAIIFVPFPVQLRVYPSSITVSSVSDFQCVREAIAWENATAISLSSDGAGVQAASLSVLTATRDTRGFASRMRSNSATAYLGFNAEL